MSSSSSPPQQCIYTSTELERFKVSDSYTQLMTFIRSICDAITGHSNSSSSTSPVIVHTREFLYRLHSIVGEVPPLHQPMRFGNKAFRTWKQKLLEEIPVYLSKVLPSNSSAVVECTHYLSESFGNDTRIDYGTGHELNIFIFFLCLFKVGALSKDDLRDLGLDCFVAYIRTMRRLQIDYMLEPAGSHGVWGLDDYHCLLYVLGSAQLRKHESIVPSSIHDDAVLERFAKEYIYLEGIQFIKQVKFTAPFAETSPMLNDISGIQDWQHVHSGLLRLFEGEVLGKVPVVQHLYFGELFPCSWDIPEEHKNQASKSPVGFIDEFVTAKAPWAT